jgi:murein DD-endopeptidase MepM/ murein hydrolase activator NlpD
MARPALAAPSVIAMLLLVVCPGGGRGSAGAAARRIAEPPAGAVALASAPPQTVELTLPFQGIWGVVQGFDSGDTHVGYAAYALDFAPAEKLAGAVPIEHRRRLTDFPCYGLPVLAPADGKVVWAKSDAPDRPPHNKLKREAGNFLILEHAAGEYTELRHLQSGSVRVKVGQRVSRGQEIARCGNSGNARIPHLHVGFLGSFNPIATRPMRLSRYEVLGPDGAWRQGDGVPVTGQLLRSLSPPR